MCYQKGANYARCMAPGTCRDFWSPAESDCEVAPVVTECAAQGGCHQIWLYSHVNQTADGCYRVVGVQGTEYHVTGK